MRDETPHFYGRRKGRRLRTTMRDLLEQRLPELRFRPDHPAQPQFDGAPEDLFLEIGFGGGENLVAIAASRPDAAFLGAEPFINGVASLVRHIEERQLSNIRIWDDDVRLILGGLETGSLAGAYVLFPDPWPKHRHAARRILTPDVLDELARLVRPGGSLVLASDHSVAKSWLLKSACLHPSFRWTARRPQDWRERPQHLVPTRYMKKAEREDRVPNWFIFERLAPSEAPSEAPAETVTETVTGSTA